MVWPFGRSGVDCNKNKNAAPEPHFRKPLQLTRTEWVGVKAHSPEHLLGHFGNLHEWTVLAYLDLCAARLDCHRYSVVADEDRPPPDGFREHPFGVLKIHASGGEEQLSLAQREISLFVFANAELTNDQRPYIASILDYGKLDSQTSFNVHYNWVVNRQKILHRKLHGLHQRPFMVTAELTVSLAQLAMMHEEEMLSREEAVACAVGMARGVEALHSLGFAHGYLDADTFHIRVRGTGLRDGGYESNVVLTDLYGADVIDREPLSDEEAVQRKPNSFSPSAKYGSLLAHDLKSYQPSRFDDVISVFHIFAELCIGRLPWDKMDLDDVACMAAKEKFPESKLFSKLPRETRLIHTTAMNGEYLYDDGSMGEREFVTITDMSRLLYERALNRIGTTLGESRSSASLDRSMTASMSIRLGVRTPSKPKIATVPSPKTSFDLADEPTQRTNDVQ